MEIQLINSASAWPTVESQRKLRELWGFDSGPFLDLVAEQLEEMALRGSVKIVVREVTIGAKDYLVANVGDYSITPDIAQIAANAESPEILRILSSTCVMGAVVDSPLVEKLRDAKIDRAGCIALQEAKERFGDKAIMPILEAIRGGLTAEDAVSVVVAVMERGSDLAELTQGSVTRRTELRRRF